ncbi:zinc finger MYND domain-containing protein 10-like [Planoprotostelium fungivorum]|uniref:Zinc finger MYND domain-containing protein 10-like n=1 Tax=Planoprotostelium fungivorum TaxID=1890364 RepID=A0A2P6NFZ4_9EUKA|nr:zinc finger MYND domain-containing protein 10-like [Planoprotostelium fungivorum]
MLNIVKSKSQQNKEIHTLVKKLRTFTFEEVGTEEWTNQKETLDRLNQLAHQNASKGEEEQVKSALIEHKKVIRSIHYPPNRCNQLNVIVHELIMIDLWVTKIWPQIQPSIYQNLGQGSFLKPYLIITTEMSCVNLLEILLYHQDACEATEDAVFELVEYGYRKLNHLHSLWAIIAETMTDVTAALIQMDEALDPVEKLNRKIDSIRFDVAISSLTLIRYITDHVIHLPVGITNSLLIANDVISSVCQLLQESRPWSTVVKRDKWRFIDHNWEKTPAADVLRLSKTEAQCWLILYNLLFQKETREKYPFTSSSQATLLRLRPLIHETLVDQLPILDQFQKFLDHLSIQTPPSSTANPIRVMQVSEYESMIDTMDWTKMGDLHLKMALEEDATTTLVPKNDKGREKEEKRLIEEIKPQTVEKEEDAPPCARCSAASWKRCARCKKEWYCSRECQVDSWPQHSASLLGKTTFATKHAVYPIHRPYASLSESLSRTSNSVSRGPENRATRPPPRSLKREGLQREYRSKEETEEPRDEEEKPEEKSDEMERDANGIPSVDYFTKKYGVTVGRSLYLRAARKAEDPDFTWQPDRRLNRRQMLEVKEAFRLAPTFKTKQLLSEKFKISMEAIDRITHSKWEPTTEQVKRQETNKVMERRLGKNSGVMGDIQEESRILSQIVDIYVRDPKDRQAVKHLRHTLTKMLDMVDSIDFR